MSELNLKKNDILELSIEALGSEGEGIGRVDGYTLFVKDALPGDVIRAKVLKTKKTYGYARLEELLAPSPDRVTARCPVARQCGGCQLQHLSYESQLAYKQNKVADCLTRIGGLGTKENLPMEPVLGMEEPWYYRNKAQFPIGRKADGSVAIGFYAGRTHSIIDTSHCHIQAEVNEQILQILREFLTEYGISTYDETSHTGLVRHILTRVGFVTGEIGVCLIINGRKLPHSEVLCDRLMEALPAIRSISLNVNTKDTNVILGTEMIPLRGELYIHDYIGDVQFQISPLSFYQVNPIQTKVLYEKALEYAGLTGNEVVWDLYCGIGTISLFLAQKAKMVYGVEIVPAAIDDARRNAALNGITNAEFYVGAAEDVAPSLPHPDVIVVDPPRKGCDAKLLETILKVAPPKVVYVSCDPATLARDLRVLVDGGYTLKKVQPVDQFAHTTHVETVVELIKENY